MSARNVEPRRCQHDKTALASQTVGVSQARWTRQSELLWQGHKKAFMYLSHQLCFGLDSDHAQEHRRSYRSDGFLSYRAGTFFAGTVLARQKTYSVSNCTFFIVNDACTPPEAAQVTSMTYASRAALLTSPP